MKQKELQTGGMGTAGLVCGILGLFLVPFVLNILAIIFGAIAIQRKQKYGQAGLTLGIIGLVLWAILISTIFTVLTNIVA